MAVTGFPDGRTLTLQQEALRRVREMQQRAQQSLEQGEHPPQHSPGDGGVQRQAPGQGRPPQNGGSGGGMPPGNGAARGFGPSGQGGPGGPRQQGPGGGAGGGQPNNILSQLLGRGPSGGAGHKQGQPPPRGIAELLRRQGLGDSLGGVGETVQSAVSSASRPVAELLDSFGIDGEKLIILMVMWAVFNEHKDNKTLLMALGYLLL